MLQTAGAAMEKEREAIEAVANGWSNK